MLQESSLPRICWAEIACIKEGFVARDSAGGEKFSGQKTVALNRNTLLRRAGSKRMNGVGCGRNSAETPESRGCFHYPRVASLLWQWRRSGEHHLPDARGTIIRILCQ